MPKPHPPRRKRAHPGEDAAVAPPVVGEGLGAEAAAAAEAAAEEEASVWVDTAPAVAAEPAGWFRDDALGEATPTAPGPEPTVGVPAVAPSVPASGPVPDGFAPTAASPVVAAPAAPGAPDEPFSDDTDEAADADGEDADGADTTDQPGTIYRTVPPLPEGAGPPRRRRSRLVSILVGLLILVLVGAGGFGAGMLLPLLLPLPAGNVSVVSPAPSPTPPTASPGASAGASAGASPSARPSAAPSPSVASSPAATPRIYVVMRGDQLGRIALRFGVTLQALEDANRITNPNLIFAGQKLVIPVPVTSPDGSPTASPSAAP